MATYPQALSSAHGASCLAATLTRAERAPTFTSGRLFSGSSRTLRQQYGSCKPAFRKASAVSVLSMSATPETKKVGHRLTPTSYASTGSFVVVLGGGIIGASIAYFLAQRDHVEVTVVESVRVAAAAGGKGGGFLAGGWGDGSVTQHLHRESFKLHEQLARELNIESYRKIPTLSVTGARWLEPGGASSECQWLDGRASARLLDNDTAQGIGMEQL
eukprot:scaffold115_cov304-Prasinococcus_capsulatus_cf.AAC.29